LVGGAAVMSRMFAERQGIEEACRQISDYETQADDVTRDVLHAVRRTFITPFDRSAITDLISSMDDAIDEMQKTAKAITQFEVTIFEPQMCEMAALAEKAAGLVAKAMPLLRSVGSNHTALDEITEQIVHLEEDADNLHDQGLKALFQANRTGNAMGYIVGREIYSHLEKVLDRFEDVANEISGIVIDHA
jgi:predicted phosphate transport protein (TIGR00153 family)